MRKLRALVALSENRKEQRKELRSFILFLREYAGKDQTLRQLLKLLADKYDKMLPEKQRLSALLSLCLYDMMSSGKGEEAAAACAKLVPDLKRKKGRGWSEAVYRYVGGGRSLYNSMLKGLCLENLDYIVEVGLDLHAWTMKMSAKERIFFYREPNGSIVLLYVNEQTGDILCDESSMNGEPPLYFTADTHFVSPLYKLRKMRDILKEMFLQQGYPYVRVKLKVFYESRDAVLINKEDYEAYWSKKDMECLLYKECGYSLSEEVKAVNNWDWSVFPDMLVWSLTITRAVYDEMPADKCYNIRMIRKYIQTVVSDSKPEK